MKHLLLVMACILIVTGCQGEAKKPTSPSQTKQGQQTVTIDTEKMDIAKKIAQQHQRVDKATAVTLDHQLFVGLQVSNFNRFFLKGIRENVHQKMKQRFPKKEVHVTTDSKLYDELSKIEKEIYKKPTQAKQSLKQKLEKINKDMKG